VSVQSRSHERHDSMNYASRPPYGRLQAFGQCHNLQFAILHAIEGPVPMNLEHDGPKPHVGTPDIWTSVVPAMIVMDSMPWTF
jgi:hypothetical protein